MNPNGQFLIMVVEYSNFVLAVINVYSPKFDSLDMFHQCFSHLVNIKYDYISIREDFNDIKYPFFIRAHPLLKNTLKAWLILYPNGHDYHWDIVHLSFTFQFIFIVSDLITSLFQLL